MVDLTVATLLECTLRGATVPVVRVPVVAGFTVLTVDSLDPVAADSSDAVVSTGVLIDLVAIIAALKAFLSRLKVGTRHRVTAPGGHAGVKTGVGVHLVAMVFGSENRNLLDLRAESVPVLSAPRADGNIPVWRRLRNVVTLR